MPVPFFILAQLFSTMIQQYTIKFLKGLKNNNTKSWFDAHRQEYDLARKDFILLTSQLIKRIGEFDPPIGNLAAKECLFRINRDVRFSKNKDPYKNNMACYFNKGGKKANGAGYYFHLEPGKSFAGGGIWMPLPADLAKIRQEIDYDLDGWTRIISGSNFKKFFFEGVDSTDVLQRPPKGYAAENPAMPFLKMKSFVVTRSFTDAEIKADNFATSVAKTFQAMKPMIDFINTAVD